MSDAASDEPGVLSRETILRWIVALVLSSVVVSAVVGIVGARDEFDWTLAAVTGTAFGTIVLAGFTGALAWTTSGDVRATWELARLTLNDQQARDRPVVIVAPRTASTSEGNVTFEVLLSNIGLGPAQRIALHASYAHEDGSTSELEASPGRTLMVNEETVLPLAFAGADFRPFDFNRVRIRGHALDRSGVPTPLVATEFQGFAAPE